MVHDVSDYYKNIVNFILMSALFSDNWSWSMFCVEMCDDGNTSCHWAGMKSQSELPVLVPRSLNTKVFLCSSVCIVCILNWLQYKSLTIGIRFVQVKDNNEAQFQIYFYYFHGFVL